MDKKWKDIGILGFIVYLLSLPIMMWRSSHLGKLISIVIMVSIVLWGAKEATETITVVRARIILDSRLKMVLAQVRTIEQGIGELSVAEKFASDMIHDRTKILLDALEAEIVLKYQSLQDKLAEIEKGIAIIKEEERQIIKEKIIALKEDVITNKKTIISKEIRIACEKITDNFFLLNEDEKERFRDDLKEMGFGVKKTTEGVTEVQGYNFRGQPQWACASADVVYFPQSHYRGTRIFRSDITTTPSTVVYYQDE